MKITVDLAALVNAEFTSVDGVPGVFIPLVPNALHRIDRGGRHAYASFNMIRASAKKEYDYFGKQMIPKEYIDKYLSDPEYAGLPMKAVWLWNKGDNTTGGFVTPGALESLL